MFHGGERRNRGKEQFTTKPYANLNCANERSEKCQNDGLGAQCGLRQIDVGGDDNRHNEDHQENREQEQQRSGEHLRLDCCAAMIVVCEDIKFGARCG